MGFFPLPQANNIKKLQNLPNPDCQPFLRTFPLKFPFMLTLEPPSVNKGHFPLKIPRPAGQSRPNMAEMTREFGSKRCRSANIVISTTY
jgi:hypothetical protein